MRMLAAVMYNQGLPAPYEQSQPFRIEEVELEGPADDEVLVEIRAAGLCHSDLSQVAGLRKRKLPVVGGHEGAGIVREVGRSVKTLKEGDHVVMVGVSDCGHCQMCIEGRPVLCNSVAWSRSEGLLPNGNRKLSRQGVPLNHYSGVSSFAQYAVTMPQTLIKVDASVPLDIVAMFGCAVVTGAGSVFNAARVRPGQNVVVFGLGGVGLNAVMAAKLSGAGRIVGVDIHEGKFALARDLGCTDCVLATDPDIVQQIQALTHGGVDFAFEVSGSKPAMETALAVTRKGGEVIGVGLGASGDLYAYDHARLVSEEKVIRGSFLGSGVPARDLPVYVDYFREGRLPVDRLKSGTMGFEQLNRNLDMLVKGDVVRQILLPHGA